jgi:ankyrin repeat protein
VNGSLYRFVLCLRAALAAWALSIALATPGMTLAAQTGAYEDFNRAVIANDGRAVAALLRRGVDPNTTIERGDPALLAAAQDGSLEVVQALLKGRAKVDIRNAYGDTPIMVASLKGHLAIVKALRAAGASINHPGWTPLLYAAVAGQDQIIDYLLSAGADVGTIAPNGASAIMLAVSSKKFDTVKLLLDYGFDYNVRNDKGETALAWARRDKLPEIEKLLRDAGARE